MPNPVGLQSATGSILVPVDFKPAARAALVFSARVADDLGAPLTILHVIHEPGYWPNYYRRYGASEASLPIDTLAERRWEEFLAEVRRLNFRSEPASSRRLRVPQDLRIPVQHSG